MGWVNRLSKYVGSSINVWIEDRSGEEQTKPKAYTLYKIEQSRDQQLLLIYLNETQYLSIPLFEEALTRLEPNEKGEVFVSHDQQGKLLYWVYFE